MSESIFSLPKVKQSENKPSVSGKTENPEELLINISGYLTEVLELKPLIEEAVSSKDKANNELLNSTKQRFEIMIKAFESLTESLASEVNYSRELKVQAEALEAKKNVSLLESQLLETQKDIKIFTSEVNDFIKEKIGIFEDKISELHSVSEAIDEQIFRFNHEANLAATEEYRALKSQCEGILKSFTKKCQEDLELMKTKSISFLKECEAENKEIISRIPKVNTNKYSLKDILLISLAALGIIGNVVFIFLNWK